MSRTPVSQSITAEQWIELKRLFTASFLSSLHFSIASVGEGGAPHVTPIGSLLLRELGHGVYFEVFTSELSRNLRANPRVSVLAVNSTKTFWLRALLQGRFPSAPSVRLEGIASATRRPAEEAEIQAFRRRTASVRLTAGYKHLWGNLQYVRDIRFESIKPVALGVMTRGLGLQ